MAMKNAKQDIRLSSVVSLEKDVANYRDTIKTMKASHADELLLLREAHEAEADRASIVESVRQLALVEWVVSWKCPQKKWMRRSTSASIPILKRSAHHQGEPGL